MIDASSEVEGGVMPPRIPDYTVHIKDYGALADGLSDNTEIFNRVLKEVARRGGGRVVVGAGVYRTGPIHLQSRVELHMDAGAVVYFSRNFDDYRLIQAWFEGEPCPRTESPLDGEGVEDMAITGTGRFDGGGQAWRPVKRSKMTASAWRRLTDCGGVVNAEGTVWWPNEAALRGEQIVRQLKDAGHFDLARFEPIRSYLRPTLLSLRRCRRVLLQGPTFQNSAAWGLHLWASQDICVRQVQVRNPWYAQNGDGLDIDSCRRVLVEQSIFDVGDDAICLKSGKDQAGRDLGMPTSDVVIRDCTIFHGHGGLTIGSEMSGGVNRIRASRLTMCGTDIGLRFKSVRGRGGIVEDVAIDQVTMLDIVRQAISVDLFYQTEAASEPVRISDDTPIFRDLSLSNITVLGAERAMMVRGLPEMPVQGLSVEGFTAKCDQGLWVSDATRLRLTHLQLEIAEGPLLSLNQCTDVFFSSLRHTGTAPAGQIEIQGEKSCDLQLDLGEGPALRVVTGDEVPSGAWCALTSKPSGKGS